MIMRVLITLANICYYYDVYKVRRLLILLLFFNMKETKSL